MCVCARARVCVLVSARLSSLRARSLSVSVCVCVFVRARARASVSVCVHPHQAFSHPPGQGGSGWVAGGLEWDGGGSWGLAADIRGHLVVHSALQVEGVGLEGRKVEKERERQNRERWV